MAITSRLWKLVCIKYVWFVVIPMAFSGCNDSEGDNPMLLSFVEGSIPTSELSADGGSVVLEVEWAKTKWNVSADEVVEGSEFITQITPANAGSESQGSTKTIVKITYSANNAPAPNQQKLTLKSVTGNLTQTITLSQAAKVIVPLTVTINPGTTYQTIAGFGGANVMWGTTYLSASEIKTAFGTDDTDLGFSIFRVRLSPVSSDWPLLVGTVKEAKKYNAKIIASPWSPPANLKSNNNLVGGYLLEANYAAYATHLNDFVQYMASQDVTIDAVSIQNEPDISVTYESCDWTSTQVFNFIKNHGSSITGTKIAAAESFNFKQSYTNALLNDADAASKFHIVAGHIYGGGQAAYPLAEQKGKEVWMTEYLMNQNSTSTWSTLGEDVKWNETIQMLGTIHTAMTNNWNAYVWWYTRRYYSFLGDGDQGTTTGTVLKRGYAISQFSKFVRPGYARVAVQPATSTSLNITAYSGDGKLVVVIINPTANPVYNVALAPPSISSAEAYTTSLSANRVMEVLTPVDNAVAIDMAASSITTVVIGL